jgi:hypothetical protein
LTLSTNFQIALLRSGATSIALRHHNHYSSQQTKIHVETNPRPCVIIITSYNNCVLVIPDFHNGVEYLPSSESHPHNAYVSVILRKATFSFVMSVRPCTYKYSILTGRIFIKYDTGLLSETLSTKFKFH